MNALLLVDHGSRRSEANELLQEIADLIQARVGSQWIVHFAHMELAPPTIADAFQHCVDDGATMVVVHPFMLAKGKHVTEDIPLLVADAAEAHPQVDYRITDPLAPHAAIVDIVLDRASDVMED